MTKGQGKDTDFRSLSPAQILTWVGDVSGVMRVRTDLDTIPGGYTAAMVPTLVRWQDSKLTGDDPFVILRNVNYGGNPFERTTILHSLEMPLNSVESVELTLVPLAAKGVNHFTHHVQLRFIFAEGQGAKLLTGGSAGTGSHVDVDDVVLSWECWRPPGVSFSMRKGIGKLSYALVLRGYVGAQSYLEDQIRGRPWTCYRLRMPGGAHGVRELLQVALAIGDGAARYTLGNLLQQGMEKWMGDLPPGVDESETDRARWAEIMDRLEDATAPNAEAFALEDDQHTYNGLLRSCAMLARYTILVTAKRLVAQGHRDGINLDRLPEPLLGAIRPWMEDIASGDHRGFFHRAPVLIGYLIEHRASVPLFLPDELDDAGLLEHRNGERWEVVYSRDQTRPYGSEGLNRSP